MTETEIAQQIADAKQFNTAINYSLWADERRKAKLSTDHELWQAERDAAIARQNAANTEAGRKYKAKLEADRKAKQAENDAEIDRELEPQKQRLMREWLASNLDQTAADFEKKAWHLLKENLVEQRKTEIVEADKRAMLATGRYSL